MFHRIFDPALIKLRAHQARTKRFEPKVSIALETDRYLIKTAETESEFSQVLRLRYEVFLKEGLHKRSPITVDVDRYDFYADHLLIIEKHSRRIVGTYRLLSSLFTKEFYSESEFKMNSLLALDGNKLELGRACTAKDFRSGIAITLLWRGLAKYIAATQSQFLFGCASIKVMDPVIIARLTKWMILNDKMDRQTLGVEPIGRFRIPNLHALIESESVSTEDSEIEKLIPSLLHAYFKAGAKVSGTPALDRSFKCIDFLTVLDTKQISESFERKYQIC